VREMENPPGNRQYNSRTISGQLPPGSVYLDIGWWEGPNPAGVLGSWIKDDDLRLLLRETGDEPADDAGLVRRSLEFTKGGHRWSIFIYRREPVSWMDRQLLGLVLRSFRFEPGSSTDF